MKGELGLRAYDKDTGNIIPGAQIAVQDGEITVKTAFLDCVLPNGRTAVTYCYRVVDTDPDSPMFGKEGWGYIGIESVSV